MKAQAILAANPIIKKKVYERYPRTKMEKRGCEREKARLDALRGIYAKRLFEEAPTKKEYE